MYFKWENTQLKMEIASLKLRLASAGSSTSDGEFGHEGIIQDFLNTIETLNREKLQLTKELSEAKGQKSLESYLMSSQSYKKVIDTKVGRGSLSLHFMLHSEKKGLIIGGNVN